MKMTKDIDAAMNSMPPEWKSRWCNSHMCACLGCANKSGGLTAKGYTYQDWMNWVSRNKKEYMNGLSPIKEVKWSMEPKEMTNQKDDLVDEIQDLQTQIDEYVRKIIQLKGIVQVKEQQLQEFPITLQRIIEECMLGRNREIQLDLVENILDRVEAELLPKKSQSYSSYNEGWDDCIEELKKRLRE